MWKTHKRKLCFYGATPPCSGTTSNLKKQIVKLLSQCFDLWGLLASSTTTTTQEEQNQSVRPETPRRKTLPASQQATRSARSSAPAFPFILGTFLYKVPWLLSPLRRPLVWPEGLQFISGTADHSCRPPGVGQQQPKEENKLAALNW